MARLSSLITFLLALEAEGTCCVSHGEDSYLFHILKRIIPDSLCVPKPGIYLSLHIYVSLMFGSLIKTKMYEEKCRSELQKCLTLGGLGMSITFLFFRKKTHGGGNRTGQMSISKKQANPETL